MDDVRDRASAPAAVILPVLVQVGLTFLLLLWMGRTRVGHLLLRRR